MLNLDRRGGPSEKAYNSGCKAWKSVPAKVYSTTDQHGSCQGCFHQVLLTGIEAIRGSMGTGSEESRLQWTEYRSTFPRIRREKAVLPTPSRAQESNQQTRGRQEGAGGTETEGRTAELRSAGGRWGWGPRAFVIHVTSWTENSNLKRNATIDC